MIGPVSGLGAMVPVRAPEGAADPGLSYYTNQGVGDLGFEWSSLLGDWSKAGIDIVKNITDPRYNAGTYTRTDAQGNTIVYSQPAGSTVPIFSTTDVSSSIGANARLGTQTSGGIDPTILLVLGLGFAAIMMLRR